MTIMELGAIGELVGGVAVIASLVYVGLQVPQRHRTNGEVTLICLRSVRCQPRSDQVWE